MIEHLVLGAHGRHHVVEVGKNMNEGIETCECRSVPSGGPSHSGPTCYKHDCMVVHMQDAVNVKYYAWVLIMRSGALPNLIELLPCD